VIDSALADWHQIIKSGDPGGLDSLLSDDVVFHSPILHTPQVGKAVTALYLTAAFHVIVNGTFRYIREVVGSCDTILEFEVEIDGLLVNGVDMIKWSEEGKITEFKVMLRPLKAVNLIHQKMAKMLRDKR
jgi:hypothetical protein